MTDGKFAPGLSSLLEVNLQEFEISLVANLDQLSILYEWVQIDVQVLKIWVLVDDGLHNLEILLFWEIIPCNKKIW